MRHIQAHLRVRKCMCTCVYNPTLFPIYLNYLKLKMTIVHNEKHPHEIQAKREEKKRQGEN